MKTIALILIASVALTACTPKEVHQAKELKNASELTWSQGIQVFTDPETKCEYLWYNYGSGGGVVITPRLDRGHQQICR